MSSSPEPNHRRRPSHSTVVAYLALFVALTTGSAWAAATIGPNDIENNAIRTRHIQNGAVKAQKLANGAVTTGKLAQGSVKTARISDRAVTGNKVAVDSLTGDNINESTLFQVPDAAHAVNADHASGANTLGGIAADRYQRSCTPGAIAGHVYVKGAPDFPSTYYTSAPTWVLDLFNCTGSTPAVRVKRIGAGTYYIDFPGISQGFDNLVATGNVTVDPQGVQDNNDIVTYKFVFDNAINRTVFRVVTAGGQGGLSAPEDREFSFSVDG
jgi:hypothetical protein